MDLGHLHPAPGSTHAKKRVGRGPGSGGALAIRERAHEPPAHVVDPKLNTAGLREGPVHCRRPARRVRGRGTQLVERGPRHVLPDPERHVAQPQGPEIVDAPSITVPPEHNHAIP